METENGLTVLEQLLKQASTIVKGQQEIVQQRKVELERTREKLELLQKKNDELESENKSLGLMVSTSANTRNSELGNSSRNSTAVLESVITSQLKLLKEKDVRIEKLEREVRRLRLARSPDAKYVPDPDVLSVPTQSLDLTFTATVPENGLEEDNHITSSNVKGTNSVKVTYSNVKGTNSEVNVTSSNVKVTSSNINDSPANSKVVSPNVKTSDATSSNVKLTPVKLAQSHSKVTPSKLKDTRKVMRSPEEDGLVFDTSLEEVTDGQKLKLQRQRGKRSRYSEEISPEMKRIKLSTTGDQNPTKNIDTPNKTSEANNTSPLNNTETEINHVNSSSKYAIRKLRPDHTRTRPVKSKNENAHILVQNTCMDDAYSVEDLNIVPESRREKLRVGSEANGNGKSRTSRWKHVDFDLTVMCVPETLAVEYDDEVNFDEDNSDSDDNDNEKSINNSDNGKSINHSDNDDNDKSLNHLKAVLKDMTENDKNHYKETVCDITENSENSQEGTLIKSDKSDEELDDLKFVEDSRNTEHEARKTSRKDGSENSTVHRSDAVKDADYFNPIDNKQKRKKTSQSKNSESKKFEQYDHSNDTELSSLTCVRKNLGGGSGKAKKGESSAEVFSLRSMLQSPEIDGNDSVASSIRRERASASNERERGVDKQKDNESLSHRERKVVPQIDPVKSKAGKVGRQNEKIKKSNVRKHTHDEDMKIDKSNVGKHSDDRIQGINDEQMIVSQKFNKARKKNWYRDRVCVDLQSGKDQCETGNKRSANDVVTVTGAVEDKSENSGRNVCKYDRVYVDTGRSSASERRDEIARNVCKDMREVDALFETPESKSSTKSRSESLGEQSPPKDSVGRKKPLFKCGKPLNDDVVLRRSPRKHKTILSQSRISPVKSPNKLSTGSLNRISPSKSANTKFSNTNSFQNQISPSKSSNTTSTRSRISPVEYSSKTCSSSDSKHRKSPRKALVDAYKDVDHAMEIDPDETIGPDHDVTIAPESIQLDQLNSATDTFNNDNHRLNETNEHTRGSAGCSFNSTEAESLDVYNVMPMKDGMANTSKRFQVVTSKKTSSKACETLSKMKETSFKTREALSKASIGRLKKVNDSQIGVNDTDRPVSEDEAMSSQESLHDVVSVSSGSQSGNSSSNSPNNGKNGNHDRSNIGINSPTNVVQIINWDSPNIGRNGNFHSPSAGGNSDVDSPLLLKVDKPSSTNADKDDDGAEWMSKALAKKAKSVSQPSRRSLRSSQSNCVAGGSNNKNRKQSLHKPGAVKSKIFSSNSVTDFTHSKSGKLNQKYFHQTTLTQGFFSPKKNTPTSTITSGVVEDVDDQDGIDGETDEDIQLALRLSLLESMRTNHGKVESHSSPTKNADGAVKPKLDTNPCTVDSTAISTSNVASVAADCDVQVISPFKKPLSAAKRDTMSRKKGKSVKVPQNAHNNVIYSDKESNSREKYGRSTAGGQNSCTVGDVSHSNSKRATSTYGSRFQDPGHPIYLSQSLPEETESTAPDDAGVRSQSLRLNGSLDPAADLSILCRETDTLPSLDNDFAMDGFGAGSQNVPRTSTLAMEDSEDIACSSVSVKFPARRKQHHKQFSDKENMDPVPVESLENSFDRPPKKQASKIAQVEVVRKQSERQKLPGYGCRQCYGYFEAAGHSDSEIQSRMNLCSRHRAEYVPPDTPPHFWSIDFMDTQDQPQTVENHVDADVPTYRRRRRLQKHFKAKDENSTVSQHNDSQGLVFDDD